MTCFQLLFGALRTRSASIWNIVLWILISAACMGPVLRPTWMLIGTYYWALIEYGSHRWLMHLKQFKYHYVLHGAHHKHPTNTERAHVPFYFFYVVSPPACALVYLVVAALGIEAPLQVSATILFGAFCGYLVFEHVHYKSHMSSSPSQPKHFMYQYHNSHHCASGFNYGFTTTFIDYWSGTLNPSLQPTLLMKLPLPPLCNFLIFNSFITHAHAHTRQ